MKTFEKKEIKKKSQDFDRWYTDVILKAKLADYAPIKGCMVIRPYGYALWESIQHFMDKHIKERGVENAYFPTFIPLSYLEKEKEHVEGFSPHFAVVTHAGGEELKEKLVVRPTSETMMYAMYKKWTQSWRDLPILINQWNNIVRWEKRTYLFLRTSEFLWQEGHCAHVTHEESIQTVLWALDMYQKTYNELMAIYGIAGVKSDSEKFAGAAQTFAFEMLMPDGKALQGCTSHDLGQNFAKAFEWTVLDKDGKGIYPWQNSWGFSTRSIGGLIMVHGDDDGLVLPPKIAPIKLVIIPVLGKENSKVLNLANKIKESIEQKLSDFSGRVKIWGSPEKTVGWKLSQSELMGIPLEITVGPKEVERNGVVICYRKNINLLTGEKDPEFLNVSVDLSKNNLSHEVETMLNYMQNVLLKRHKKFTQENTHDVDSYDEFKKIMSTTRGFIRSFWCENQECEKKIKEETKATTRVLPLEAKEEKGICIYCGKSASHRWYFAQAY